MNAGCNRILGACKAPLPLAGTGPLADGYALALTTYAARTPAQNVLADRILDGLDRMKAASEGGRPTADTGPDWRRAFDERTGGALTPLGEDNVAAIRTATAALYIQSMALLGKDGTSLDGHELDKSIATVFGTPVSSDHELAPKVAVRVPASTLPPSIPQEDSILTEPFKPIVITPYFPKPPPLDFYREPPAQIPEEPGSPTPPGTDPDVA